MLGSVTAQAAEYLYVNILGKTVACRRSVVWGDANTRSCQEGQNS
jgi:hypothetical protein